MSKYAFTLAWLCAGLLCAEPVYADMAGTKYSVSMLNSNAGGGGVLYTDSSGRLTLLLSVGQLGVQSAGGAKYSVNSGIINSLRPATATLDFSYAYPNPFKKRLGHTVVTFTKLTYDAVIKIYTVSGELVKTIRKSSSVDNIAWDVRNDDGQNVASGLYIYLIESGGLFS
ncbi:MAG: T9SS type A sorting domain-containing protein [Elusimicrobiaceae bacterium]|nr:T9SS type A sorting domain-containing protein [Elusimicrobiaceae bacterium]